MENEHVFKIEEKLDGHIQTHGDDFKKLLWWIIGIMVILIGSTASWFVSLGQTQEKIRQLEAAQDQKVSRQEMLGSVSLMEEKFKNINEKLDDIKRGLNIR